MAKQDWHKISAAEWEAICDRCGKCCLITLEDEDTGDIYHTNVLCRYYDLENRLCTVYEKRCELVPHCLKLTPENVDKLPFMPKTCAYRRLFEADYNEQPLQPIAGRVVSELEVTDDDLEDHIVDWEDL